MVLMHQFPRLYALELDKDCVVFDRWHQGSWKWNWNREIRGGGTSEQLLALCNYLANVTLGSEPDKWEWNLEPDGMFSVSSTRTYIDDNILIVGITGTRWCKLVPIKLNILMWRVLWNRIPTKVNLVHRGVYVPSILCQ